MKTTISKDADNNKGIMMNEDYDIKDFSQEEVSLRDYLLRKAHPAPDVQAELDDFMYRQGMGKSHRALKISLGVVAAVAASLLLLFVLNTGKRGLSVPDGAVVAYEAATEDVQQGVTLQKGDEEPVTVNGNRVYTTPSDASMDMVMRNVLSTPQNATAEVTLADGTEVMLNAGSRLTYPQVFKGKTREVQLQGEAYFKVHHDARHPFIVHAGNISTKVLGTEFNVRAYAANDTHVTLLRGSVLVSSAIASKRIKPGEDAAFNGSSLHVRAVETDVFTAWKQGEFYFDNEPLLDIAKEIGKWYNVSVVFQSPEKMHIRLFFAAPKDASIQELVEVLNSMNKAKFVYHNDQLVIE